MENNVYEHFKEACARKGTNITTVLISIGRSSGSTGSWKAGQSPRLDLVMEIADHLGISLDELCYGYDGMQAKKLSDDDREWLSIIERIPEERREVCKDFLRTHMALPEKYVDKKDA